MSSSKFQNVNPAISNKSNREAIQNKPKWFGFALAVISRLTLIGLYTFDIGFDLLNGVGFLDGKECESSDNSKYCENWQQFKHKIWESLTIGNQAF